MRKGSEETRSLCAYQIVHSQQYNAVFLLRLVWVSYLDMIQVSSNMYTTERDKPTTTTTKEANPMKYDLSKLMKKAWSLFRAAAKKAAISFGEALRRAWAWLKVQEANTAKVDAAAEAAGIEEEYHSWAGWQAFGRMVIHTETAAFKVEVADPTTRKGTRIKSYFLYSQTQPSPMA